MGHHACELDAGRRVEHARDVHEPGQRGVRQACAAAAAVDLDEDREGIAVRRCVGDRLGDHEVVGDDAQVDALATQFGHSIELGRHHAHAVEDVLEAALSEIARLGEGGDRNTPIVTFDRHAADLH